MSDSDSISLIIGPGGPCGIDDEFDSESTQEDQQSIAGSAGSGNENIYDLVASSSTLLLTATAEARELDALVQVEIFSPSGMLLAASLSTAGPAVAVTVPTLAGTYKIKVKNLGQGAISYETLLITATNWLP